MTPVVSLRARRLAAAVVAAVLLTLSGGAASPVRAQDGFLFSSPILGVTLRVGPLQYRAQGDVFDTVTTHLTLERSDFRAPVVGADLVIMPLPRLDVVLGISRAEARTWSEFRDFVEEDAQGNPVAIEQVTRLRTIPVTASVRYQLRGRGERIGELVWLPRATQPYLGGGVGVTWYRLLQEGDFVNFQTYAISTTTVESEGSAVTWHALAGLDHWFTPRLGLNAEARYSLGGVAPSDGFHRFREIDLSALQASLGVSFRW